MTHDLSALNRPTILLNSNGLIFQQFDIEMYVNRKDGEEVVVFSMFGITSVFIHVSRIRRDVR